MGPVLLQDKLGKLHKIAIQEEGINPSLVSLIPCHKVRFKHALSDIADNFGVHLSTVLLVSLACEGPQLHDEGGDFSSSEH